MSRTTFEKLGIPYEERDGIFYPVLVAGTEKADIDAGKYGRMWIKYIREEYPMRYKSLVRFGELEERADEVNDTAYELLDDIEAKWLKKHKPKNPNSFTEQLQLRTQTKDIKDKILERVKITAPSSYVDTEKEMDEFINTWKDIAKDEKLYYFVPAVADDKKRLLTYYGEYYGDKEKLTLSSMRDVEQSSTVFYWEGV